MAVALLATFVIVANIWVVSSTRKQVVSLENLQSRPLPVLLLGTSHKTLAGDDNEFFQERIKTAYNLYRAGYTKRILLSGDHKSKYYNEPLVMRKALIELGVPDSLMIADDGGVRTLDSVIRCKQLFDVDSVIIVTQEFHAYRALFISNYYELPAVVVMSKPEPSSGQFAILFREILARPLAVLDLYVFHRQPLFDQAKIN